MRNFDAENKCEFKEVPACLEDIDPQWCDAALRKANVIGPGIKVSNVHVERLINEKTGAIDGGGMTAAQLVRIKLTYEGETDTYKPPNSIVAKCLLNGDLMVGKLPMHWRLFMVLISPTRNIDEEMWRRDVVFYREVIPCIRETYSHPRVFYTGMIDGGNRGFFNEVIRPMPHKIRTITLMQDMQGWESQMVTKPTFLSVEQTTAILQNAAILHANFWGDKNKEIRDKNVTPSLSEQCVRWANVSKFKSKSRKDAVCSSKSIRKKLTKVLETWDSHKWFQFSSDSLVPSWLSNVSPSNDNTDSINILKDKNVLEMLKVYSERYPKFSAEFTEPFLNMPSQTILHGDIHNGNHMYAKKDNKVKVVAFDFQSVGHGVAVSDIAHLFRMSKRHVSWLEDIELLKNYHEALVLSGVKDYSFVNIKQHFIIALLETLTSTLLDYSFGMF
eukprot:CAMPEP_0194288290 /NCGR_PEP_ID=MMETSP0169-20130528/36505_1 /TAXON_ID=218684 /ORGANISM="Corethron pennatum, Strain L29A3" /LENGTH=443 /DNA_ID=CAMNT_0039035245 /DNA_START=44 /DNA_END=1375 /DNA_ORIENTATION=+